MGSMRVRALALAAGLVAAALCLDGAANAQTDASVLAASADTDATDALMLSHQPEFRPLIDMPRDQGFVAQLLLMRAHLRVGLALYEAGDMHAGAAHCSHPLAELYDDLALQLDDRGLPPFDGDLRALVEDFRAGASHETIRAATDKANASIDASIAAVDGGQRQSPGFVIAVAAALLQAAQQDYRNSLGDREISSVIEYQDSWAFFEEARFFVTAARPVLAARNAAALADLDAQLDSLAAVWPSMQPPKQAIAAPGTIERILARIAQLQGSFS
jgi:hypothetical protein